MDDPQITMTVEAGALIRIGPRVVLKVLDVSRGRARLEMHFPEIQLIEIPEPGYPSTAELESPHIRRLVNSAI